MNNDIDPNELWDDLANDIATNSFRQQTFATAISAARSRRRRRLLIAVAGCLALPLLAAMAIMINRPQQPEQLNAPKPAIPAGQASQTLPQEKKTSRTIPGTSIEIITDEELLALFKGGPVGLIGEPGRQKLVFLDGQQPYKD